MPGWVEKLLINLILTMFERLSKAARIFVGKSILEKRAEERQEERKEITEKIEMERLKPVQEQNDDNLRDLHRRLRNVDSD